MSDVKPCPWCLMVPDITDPNTFRLTDGSKWGALQCCGTGPEVRTGYGPVEEWREDAIEAWNNREEEG